MSFKFPLRKYLLKSFQLLRSREIEGLEPFHAISRRVQNLAQESAKRARETKDENRHLLSRSYCVLCPYSYFVSRAPFWCSLALSFECVLLWRGKLPQPHFMSSKFLAENKSLSTLRNQFSFELVIQFPFSILFLDFRSPDKNV